jgi:hypothetical protein
VGKKMKNKNLNNNNFKKLVSFSIIVTLIGLLILSMPGAMAADIPHDYTVQGHVEIINDAIIQNYNPTDASGTGVFDSFLRLKGGGPAVYNGYNSDGKGSDLEFYEDHAWTKSYLLTNVPLVLKDPDNGGPLPAQYYREFQLDINQNKGSYLTLDELEVYWSDDPNADNIWMYGYANDFDGHATKAWELDFGGDNHWIILNYDLSPGSGKRDLIVWIPDSLFPDCGYMNPLCTTNVILYTEFGGDDIYPNNDGFEEWGVAVYALISGHKFHDYNMNGVWDSGEPPLEGWEIYCENETGHIQTAITDENGYYYFIVNPGTKNHDYIIYEGCPDGEGWIQSLPIPTNGCGSGIYEFTLSAGDIVTDIDFGNFKPVDVTACKVEDLDGDLATTDDQTPIEDPDN